MAQAIRVFGKENQFFLDDGTVNNGGALYIYQANSTTPLTTYQTSDTTGATNGASMTLDSAGRLQADVYITQAAKFIWKNSSGVQVGNPIDNITMLPQIWSTVAKSSNYTTTVNDLYKMIVVDATSGNITITLVAAATAGAGYLQAICKTDSSANTVIIDPNGSETIGTGNTTYTLYDKNASILFVSDGTNWQIVARHFGANVTLPTGNITLSDGSINVNDQDSRTNTVARPLTVSADTTGTPAANIGTGILIRAESADESPSEFGALDFVASDVTAGSEDTFLSIKERIAGAAIDEVYAFKATAANTIAFTHAATADRIVTWPDTDISQHIVQRVNTQTGAVATGTTIIPKDDTIPQNTEGDQYMTLAITPKNTANILYIDVRIGSTSNSNAGVSVMAVALFQDATASALAVAAQQTTQVANASISLHHKMTAGTTSATTFKVRIGSHVAGTTTFNGSSAAREYGGVLASSITITEVSP